MKTIPSTHLVALIEQVRRVSRQEILPRFRNLSTAEIDSKSTFYDLVTVADKKAEDALTQVALDLFPQATVIGEEAVAAEPNLLASLDNAELAVVIDPIDGTGNFVAGLGTFGVIIAIIRDGKTIAGLLYDPLADDWVIAEKGMGTWFAKEKTTPRRLFLRQNQPLHEVIGFVPMSSFPKPKQSEIFERFKGVGQIQWIRCSCHEYRSLAFGRADFIISPAAKPWDHAAGKLVIEEAGGYVQTESDRWSDLPWIIAAADKSLVDKIKGMMSL